MKEIAHLIQIGNLVHRIVTRRTRLSENGYVANEVGLSILSADMSLMSVGINVDIPSTLRIATEQGHLTVIIKVLTRH